MSLAVMQKTLTGRPVAIRGGIAAPPALLLGLAMMGCTPTVQVAAPTEPIEINLNIKIEQDVRIRMDDEVNDLIADNPDIFN